MDFLSNGVNFKKEKYEIVVLRMSHVQVIDMTEFRSLKFFLLDLAKARSVLFVLGIIPRVYKTLNKTHLGQQVDHGNIFPNIDEAFAYAKLELVKY